MWLKAFLGASAALLSVGVAAAYWFKSASQPIPPHPVADATPIACTLSADDLAVRRSELASFWERAREISELEDGYAFRFAFDTTTLDEAARVIAGESHCCSFLEFRLTARAADDLLLVEVTGPAGTKELLSASLKSESVQPQPEASAARLN